MTIQQAVDWMGDPDRELPEDYHAHIKAMIDAHDTATPEDWENLTLTGWQKRLLVNKIMESLLLALKEVA